MRQATENYQKNAYILKLDISGFFMNMNKSILLSLLENIINKKYLYKDKDLLFHLCKIIIENDPTNNCLIKGKKSDWI
jgi:RNA-directed DNA polymerase